MNQSIVGLQQSIVPVTSTSTKLPTSDAQSSFASKLKEAIQGVNDAQIIADKKTEALVQGNIDDLHNVMITAQKASITLEMSVQIQRKVIDAYNEIMRMQV